MGPASRSSPSATPHRDRLRLKVTPHREAGELRRDELLRCRVRYFSDGVAIGSKLYMEEFVERFK